jgi:hypothetical protein
MIATQSLCLRQWLRRGNYTATLSAHASSFVLFMGTCPTMVWPSDVHEAKNTADSDIGVRQTALDQVAVFTLLNPGSQGAKTAIDFAHLAFGSVG